MVDAYKVERNGIFILLVKTRVLIETSFCKIEVPNTWKLRLKLTSLNTDNLEFNDTSPAT